MTGSGTIFDRERLVTDCRAALEESRPEQAVRELVAGAVSEPSAVIAQLGEPKRSAIVALHRSPELTVLNVIWAPRMTLMPHDHRMWAVIGIYSGREDNIFWRRIEGDPGGKVEAAGARALSSRDAIALGHDIIHAVTNPLAAFTGAIHVYGGDFFAVDRSEWDPGTLLEQPYDLQRALQLFEDGNPR
jgi:predicted metal-dependent enzyme (double-stranded beta helix superfamily)